MMFGVAVAADYDSPDYWRDDWKRLASRGEGFVVWESNRTGMYRIWTRKLDGSDLRQVSPDEKDRSHYCAHISPDGKRLVYMSFPESYWQDGFQPSPKERKNPMHIINIDGTGDRVLLDNARTYQEHRAAIWYDDDEITCIDENGVTIQLNVDTGKSFPLTKVGLPEFGWLINPTRTFACGRAIWITFSPYDSVTKTVTPSRIYGGCQGYLSRDGVWAIYCGGQGGPLRRVHLATRKSSIIVGKKDPRLPKGRKHMYFPMLSANQRLFAFGAAPKSTWDRAPKSDYDVFVAHCDPNTLELIGRPVRFSFAKLQDRFPSVFLAPNAKTLATWPKKALKQGKTPAAVKAAWPAKKDGLVFLWGTADEANLVKEPATGKQRGYRPYFRRQVWLDHYQAMHFLGKGAVLMEDAGPNVVTACKKTNAFSIEATIMSADTRQGKAGRDMQPARIVTIGQPEDGTQANAVLAQASGRLFLQLKTRKAEAEAEKKGTGWIDLKYKFKKEEPIHVVVTCQTSPGLAAAAGLSGKPPKILDMPGKLVVYINGKQTMTTDAFKGDLGDWAPGKLLFGGLESGKEAWSGDLEGIALYDRALGAEEVQANYSNYRKIIEARKPVPKHTLRGKLVAKAKIPKPEDIGLYRAALVEYEYETGKRNDSLPSTRFRVVHWGILDRRYVGLDERKVGETYVLVLEFASHNPQLDRLTPCTEPLDPGLDLPRYFDVDR